MAAVMRARLPHRTAARLRTMLSYGGGGPECPLSESPESMVTTALCKRTRRGELRQGGRPRGGQERARQRGSCRQGIAICHEEMHRLAQDLVRPASLTETGDAGPSQTRLTRTMDAQDGVPQSKPAKTLPPAATP